MTKKKKEIANGIRLENASWRTWAKQRGNLPTVSPETLNWLKDSDVTWLYGPLHEAEAVPPPKVASVSERFGLDLGHHSTTTATTNTTTTTTPTNPTSSSTGTSLPSPTLGASYRNDLNDEDDEHMGRATDRASQEAYPPAQRRIQHTPDSGFQTPLRNPAFAHAGFGSYVNNAGKKSILKHRTLEEILAHPGQLAGPSTEHEGATPSSSTTPGTPRRSVQWGSAGSEDGNSGKRHITFNSRVDQCIALDPNQQEEEHLHHHTRFALPESDAEGPVEEQQEQEQESQEEGEQHPMSEIEDTPSSKPGPGQGAERSDDSQAPATGNDSPSHSEATTPPQYSTIALLAPTNLKAFGPAAEGAPAVVGPNGAPIPGANYGYGPYDNDGDDEEEGEEEEDSVMGYPSYEPPYDDFYYSGSSGGPEWEVVDEEEASGNGSGGTSYFNDGDYIPATGEVIPTEEEQEVEEVPSSSGGAPTTTPTTNPEEVPSEPPTEEEDRGRAAQRISTSVTEERINRGRPTSSPNSPTSYTE